MADVSLEGRQSEKVAKGEREGSALRIEGAIDEALDVAGIVRSAWTWLGGECSKSLR